MQPAPPPQLARILRTTLDLVEYYAGPAENDVLICELKSTLRRHIAELDRRESAAVRHPQKTAASLRES